MLNYSKKCINTIAICITLAVCTILFIILDVCFLNISEEKYDQNIHVSFGKFDKYNGLNRKDLNSIKIGDVFIELMQVADIYDDPNIKVEDTEQESNNDDYDNNVSADQININSTWRIEIPKIGLIAPIKSGTTQDVLATAVGHFEESVSWNGNVALAGHNRGYNCNFFQNIKELDIGDKIIYSTNKGKREYRVIVNKIIQQTDWSYIENTEDNRITLITCVENMYEYRRCVQAVEII